LFNVELLESRFVLLFLLGGGELRSGGLMSATPVCCPRVGHNS